MSGATLRRLAPWLGFAALVVAVVVTPFLTANYRTYQLGLVAVYLIALLGLNLLTGFNGQFSLGHSAFYAIGAYTAAIMMENMGIHYAWTLPAAATPA